MTGLGRHSKNAIGFALVWALAALLHPVRFTRQDEFPGSGPALVVANHLSTTEFSALARATIGHRRFPHFLAKVEVFSWPVVGRLARWTGMIPVCRDTATAAEALKGAGARLDAGQVVALYPEGRLTREPDLSPGPFKTGAARLALAHPGTPVIPVGMWGPRPGRQHLWRRHRVRLVVGEPLYLDGDPESQEDVRLATKVIREAVVTLVDQAREESTG